MLVGGHHCLAARECRHQQEECAVGLVEVRDEAVAKLELVTSVAPRAGGAWQAVAFSAALRSKMATEMGPTECTNRLAGCVSPVGRMSGTKSSSLNVVPTFTTTTPVFSVLTSSTPGCPAAEITTSAAAQSSARFLLERCINVTVAPLADRSWVRGWPTNHERPITATCLPSRLTPWSSSTRTMPWQPAGGCVPIVGATASGRPRK
mmetsp:Transcript_55547/g.149825  ORF Transcript_55547/g.149825 Transcript_55547/m.149825 type:complete len:206 (+) Transcript_55547:231-848(+)